MSEYVIDPEAIKEACKKGIGLPRAQMFETIHQELHKLYPGRIAKEMKWHFNVSGGAAMEAALLYTSLSEYLIFWGTPVGTGGHGCRYDDFEFYEFVLDGEIRWFYAGEIEPQIQLPGATPFHAKGEAGIYTIQDHAWLIEYARGPGNLMQFFLKAAILETVTSTQDWKSLWDTILDFGKLALPGIVQESMAELSPAEIEALPEPQKSFREIIRESMGAQP